MVRGGFGATFLLALGRVLYYPGYSLWMFGGLRLYMDRCNELMPLGILCVATF